MEYLKGALIGLALALLSNSKTQLERVTKGKHSSLFGLVISKEEKKFCNIDTWSLRSLYVLTIWVSNFLAKGFWRKSCS